EYRRSEELRYPAAGILRDPGGEALADVRQSARESAAHRVVFEVERLGDLEVVEAPQVEIDDDAVVLVERSDRSQESLAVLGPEHTLAWRGLAGRWLTATFFRVDPSQHATVAFAQHPTRDREHIV